MSRRRGLIAAGLTVLLCSLLCLGLWRWDNKYTRTEIQPINGVLFFSPNTELCYLTREWMVYPGVLLTPETVGSYSGYRCYSDIGGAPDRTADSMTYRLSLILPETPRTYALELPEVFSACRLYVDGRLLLTLGDPEPDTYHSGMASRPVTFTASGETELLLTSTDRSGIGRGLTYPPAFGTPDAVRAVREGRLLLHGAAMILALIGTLLALTIGLRAAPMRGILTALLCLALAVVTGYPLYHGLGVTGVQPWYTIEPACAYALLLLALLLFGRIYALPLRRRLWLAAPCVVGLALTLIRFGAAAVLPDAAAVIFSFISALLKAYTALCLIGMSLRALWQGKCRSTLLLCGSAALAVCLCWDRLLPAFEPILGGWLSEVGGILLVAALAAAIWLDAVEAYRFRLTYEASFEQMEQRLAMQKEHYSQLSGQVKLAREAGHDLRHHMRILRELADQENWPRLTHYLAEFEPHMRERDITLWSDHPIADAVLNHYAAAARRLNVAFDVRFAVPPTLPIPNAELCILLSNLLENAIEAITRQSGGTRRLYLRGDVHDNQLRLVLDNTYTGELRQKNGIWLSTKHTGAGLGISSVTSIVEKYGGLTDFSADGSVFHASLLIPLAESTHRDTPSEQAAASR